MPTATLLLRENTSASLASIVEKSQHQKPPLPEYDLQVHTCQLDLTLTSPPPSVKVTKSTSSADEGFESDVDSLSIVSSDDSFASPNPSKTTTAETDSANGSACSDSDETDSTSTKTVVDVPVTASPAAVRTPTDESHNLVNCVCYADVKFPDLLVFVIKKEALVFKFDNLDNLQKFYTTFNTLKAVANQRAYGKNVRSKFNLLHRTDGNGVTHLEICREPCSKILLSNSYGPTSIISINTPDNYIDERILSKMNVKLVHDEFRERNGEPEANTLALQKESVYRDVKGNSKKSASTENILETQSPVMQRTGEVLRKVWNSSENLSEAPQKPERRRKIKGKAPPPPVELNQNVLKGEYIRVSVPKFDASTLEKSASPKSFANYLGASSPKLTTYQQFKCTEPIRRDLPATLARNKVNLESWTSSVPRLLKSQRARGEGRNFTPMAYRYIDTTQIMPNNSPVYVRRYATNSPPSTQISNRLFGMSSKLKDFSTVQNGKSDGVEVKNEGRWSSLGELSHKINSNSSNTDGSLKSVIKKDENKRKNEKKVTFSAYTTVQVV